MAVAAVANRLADLYLELVELCAEALDHRCAQQGRVEGRPPIERPFG